MLKTNPSVCPEPLAKDVMPRGLILVGVVVGSVLLSDTCLVLVVPIRKSHFFSFLLA